MEKSSEKRFRRLLERHFEGAAVEGRPGSGFIKILQTKQRHYQAFWKKFSQRLDQAVEKLGPDADTLREEIFDKLHTFFGRYFNESGSVFFHNTPAWQPLYHRVRGPARERGELVRIDDPGRDVMLVWKTSMLHYVKTDMTLKNMTVNLAPPDRPAAPDIRAFAFDVSEIPPKQNNERRDFVFLLAPADPQKPDALRLKVLPAKNGRKNDFAALAREAAQAAGKQVREENLRKAAAQFLRQSEADYFINRRPREFLKEQLDLWMFSYAVRDRSDFSQARIRQLHALRDISERVIDFVAEFENQLLRIWEKPKFARAVNYVVTADRIPPAILKKAASSRGAKAQAAEWRELKIVPDEFSMNDLVKGDGALNIKNGSGASGDRRFLPLDTRHFKELEPEILARLAEKHGGENAILDRALDGELVHSENWQALNTLGRKFKGRVKCVHIDPPYNTDTSGFLYVNNYKHSAWLTMMEGRIEAAFPFLADDGVFQCHIDENEHERLHLLFEQTPTLNAGTVVWDKRNPVAGALGVATQHEYVIWRMMKESRFFIPKPHAKLILRKAKKIAAKNGKVGDEVRKEFKDWIRRQNGFSVGEKSYCEIDDSGRVYQSVHMGAPEPREDPKFFVPLNHPATGKPCPVPQNGWSGTPEFMRDLIKQGRILFGASEKVQPRRKYYLDEGMHEPVSTVFSHGGKGKADLDKLGLEFPYCHPVALYEHFIGAATGNGNASGVVLDFFAGSGTTAHAVLNLNRADGGDRKFILAEMGKHFHSALLPRVKKILFSSEWKEGKPKESAGNLRKGGGAFKYYALEQYEESLAHSRYRDDKPELVDPPSYVFLRDPKMAWCVEIGGESLEILLDKLHPDIDLAETLSHARGLPVKSRTAAEVVLGERGEETYRIDWKGEMSPDDKAKLLGVLRPYLWWE